MERETFKSQWSRLQRQIKGFRRKTLKSEKSKKSVEDHYEEMEKRLDQTNASLDNARDGLNFLLAKEKTIKSAILVSLKRIAALTKTVDIFTEGLSKISKIKAEMAERKEIAKETDVDDTIEQLEKMLEAAKAAKAAKAAQTAQTACDVNDVD
jgi:chromosome segregation ATPase